MLYNTLPNNPKYYISEWLILVISTYYFKNKTTMLVGKTNNILYSKFRIKLAVYVNNLIVPWFGGTTGGTKPAWFWWDSTWHWISMRVSSILRRVVGVNVAVVRVGTPLLNPTSYKEYKSSKIRLTFCY